MARRTLLEIGSRRVYLRRLSSCMERAHASCISIDQRDRLGGWLDGLQKRIHNNKAVVALAAEVVVSPGW